MLEAGALESVELSYSRKPFSFLFLRVGKINIKIFYIVVSLYQYLSYICIEQNKIKMTTIVINKGEALSRVFPPEMGIGRGKIVKTSEAYKMAMDAVKSGTAEKTCDTETTLMYNIK